MGGARNVNWRPEWHGGASYVAPVGKPPINKEDGTGQWRSHPELSLADEPAKPGRGTPGDPYNRVSSAPPAAAEKNLRRSLDDMRQLSERIKDASTWSAPPKVSAAEFERRLQEVRVKVDRVGAELKALNDAASDPANRQNVEFVVRLSDAMQYLRKVYESLKSE